MKSIFILVPSPHPTGPVKGAYALANALAAQRRVVLVFLKHGPGVDTVLDDRVEVVSLADIPGGWHNRLNAYRHLLLKAGGRAQVYSISMCFSADWVNRFCRKHAVTCASIRGNLPENYRLDYGWPGTFLAIAHLRALPAFDHVVAMTSVMARQIQSIASVRAEVIGNFVDEAPLERYRKTQLRAPGPLRFVFVGSLTRRKQPALLIDAMSELAAQEAQLDVIGEGPLRREIEDTLASRGLLGRVRLHGQLSNPYPLVAAADAFVLPSVSEGLSRAALEALHLGVPCVLREVDGNAELLRSPGAGVLFNRDADLATAMLEAAEQARSHSCSGSLLPDIYRQQNAASRYLTLLEQTP
jgi:glycosyltransferase involved in cell wall biosynthesis